MLELPITALKIGASNVRHDVEMDDNLKTLIASIASVGLLQPLVVTGDANTGFEIVAGRRRFAAVTHLDENGHDFSTVPCILVDAETAVEASLAENYAREAMKPAQIYKAFATVQASSPDYDDKALAKMFDLELDVVRRTLRLGKLHPDVFAAYEADKITGEQAQAYAATEDQDLQASVFVSFGAARHVGANQIRAALGVKSGDLKLKVVGADAYIEAGGRFERDLFNTHDENAGRVLDEELLDQLANTKLCNLIAELTGGDETVKLSFDTPKDQYGYANRNLVVEGDRAYTAEQEARIAEIEVREAEISSWIEGEGDQPEGIADEDAGEAEVEKLQEEWNELHANAGRSYPPGRKIAVPAMQGRYTYVGDKQIKTEVLEFTVYWADKEAKKDAEAAAKALAKAEAGEPASSAAAPAGEKNKGLLTNKATDALAALRKDMLKQACAEQVDDAVLWRFVFVHAHAAAHQYSYGHGSKMGLRMVHTYDNTPLGKLDCFGKDKKTFEDFMAMPLEQRNAVAAVLLSSMIDNNRHDGKEPTFIERQFGTRAQLNARRYWTPTKEFFDMFKKQILVDMIAEVDPKLASYCDREKTGTVKQIALEFFTGEVDKNKLRTPDAVATCAKALEFVPSWLRLAPPEPKPVKAKKPKADKPKAKAKASANDKEKELEAA